MFFVDSDFERILLKMNELFSLRNFVIIGLGSIAVLTAATVDLNNLFDYTGQITPVYITKDNQPLANVLTDEGATLGRVLFYDKNLSLNGTVSCGSCHRQEFAFSDTAQLSVGLDGGLTGRHSMRLINARFADEMRFFWDKRAASLEDQVTMPVQDHIEMGFSGTNGQPGIDSLINRLSGISYYQDLFTLVYGNAEVTEEKIQKALAQFVRSIQSYDSKYDVGRTAVGNDADPFPNYTAEENQGKQLFLLPPPQGGAGCAGCHRPPEFDIDFQSLNNGVIGVAGSPGDIDLFNTRAPSLRDLFNPAGDLNGPLMHNGEFTTIEQVIEHYNLVPQNVLNTNLDPRLGGPGGNLGLTTQEKAALAAFLKTLSGNNVYSDPMWSDPFDENGSITVIPSTAHLISAPLFKLNVYPNPTTDFLLLTAEKGSYELHIFSSSGQLVLNRSIFGSDKVDVRTLNRGNFILELKDRKSGRVSWVRFVKQ